MFEMWILTNRVGPYFGEWLGTCHYVSCPVEDRMNTRTHTHKLLAHTKTTVLKWNKCPTYRTPFGTFYFDSYTKIYDVHSTKAVLQPNTCKSEPNTINLEHTEPAITLSPTHQSWVLCKVKKDIERKKDGKGQKIKEGNRWDKGIKC